MGTCTDLHDRRFADTFRRDRVSAGRDTQDQGAQPPDGPSAAALRNHAGSQEMVALPIAYRLLRKVSVAKNGCWNWTGFLHNGYGKICEDRKSRLAHRISYRIFKGPIPERLELDHLCRNTKCINPTHLEAVSHRVNVLRGNGATAKHARQTHCIRGHKLSGDNLYIWSDGKHIMRTCNECVRLRRKGEES